MADGVGKGALAGAGKGAGLGATLGTIVPGVGNVIGAAVGAVGGAIVGGAKAKKNAKEREAGLVLPAEEDPTQTARRLEIDRIAKNVQAGTDSATQTAIGAGQATTAGAQSRISRVTGGAGGATVDALLKSQRAGQSASNQAVAQGQSRLPFFMNLGQQIKNRSEQRKLELELLGRAQTSADTAQKGKEDNVNSNAALASGILETKLEGSGDRIKSLANQGIGKIQGDIQPLATPEITPISGGGGFEGMPSLPEGIGGLGGGGGGTGGFDISSLGGAAFGVGG